MQGCNVPSTFLRTSAQYSAPLRVVNAFHRVGALRLAGGFLVRPAHCTLGMGRYKKLRQNGYCPELSKRRCSSRNVVVAGARGC